MATAVDLGVDDVLHVLRDIYGLEGKVKGREWNMVCPVHEDTHPSCDVNLDSGMWNCFSCNAQGDLVALGQVVLNKKFLEVLNLLRPSEPDALRASIAGRIKSRRKEFEPEPKKAKKKTKAGIEFTIPPADSYEFYRHPDLKERGFSKEALRRWGVRFARSAELLSTEGKPFEISNAIAIPIFSPDGEVLLWCYRATGDSERWFQKSRYLYTPGRIDAIRKTWFGLHLHQHERSVVVVEGALDAIWLDQNKIPAIAILGSKFTDLHKIDRLVSFKEVTIFPDHDTTGLVVASQIGTLLRKHGIPAKICRYPNWARGRDGKKAKDPQNLCGVDAQLVVERAIPWSLWVIRHQQDVLG